MRSSDNRGARIRLPQCKAVEGKNAGERVAQAGAEFGPRAEGGEGGLVDGGDGPGEGGVFRQREEDLDVVVATLEFPVVPAEDGGEGSALVVWGCDGGVVEVHQWGLVGAAVVWRHGWGGKENPGCTEGL